MRLAGTFDGVSIAWSVAEYLHDRRPHHVRDTLPRAYGPRGTSRWRGKRQCLSQATRWGSVFLRKLKDGAAGRAMVMWRAAGLPRPVLERAFSLLEAGIRYEEHGLSKRKVSRNQLSLFGQALLSGGKRSAGGTYTFRGGGRHFGL